MPQRWSMYAHWILVRLQLPSWIRRQELRIGCTSLPNPITMRNWIRYLLPIIPPQCCSPTRLHRPRRSCLRSQWSTSSQQPMLNPQRHLPIGFQQQGLHYLQRWTHAHSLMPRRYHLGQHHQSLCLARYGKHQHPKHRTPINKSVFNSNVWLSINEVSSFFSYQYRLRILNHWSPTTHRKIHPSSTSYGIIFRCPSSTSHGIIRYCPTSTNIRPINCLIIRCFSPNFTKSCLNAKIRILNTWLKDSINNRVNATTRSSFYFFSYFISLLFLSEPFVFDYMVYFLFSTMRTNKIPGF